MENIPNLLDPDSKIFNAAPDPVEPSLKSGKTFDFF